MTQEEREHHARLRAAGHRVCLLCGAKLQDDRAVRAVAIAMNRRTRNLFRTVVTCVRANGGSTALSREPRSLVKAGLVVLVKKGMKTGCGGHKSRYALTDAGAALAAEMFPA